ncbi:hypothetical protein FRX31_011424 [Thalictrum thalictroides]|uniref:Uncharacterized protein n=1 Tax=Thalictrum thalictroides TaxID=46969 RepID=A0A7J6WPX5_THATH|nr:hypothetical protein FRX31_011424 [Thalictrum thalictroides]
METVQPNVRDEIMRIIYVGLEASSSSPNKSATPTLLYQPYPTKSYICSYIKNTNPYGGSCSPAKGL